MYSANNIDDALIMSYLDGRCSSEEALNLLSWLAESTENQRYFDSFRDVWQLTAFEAPSDIDVESALDAVNLRIDALEEEKEAEVVALPWLKRNYKKVSGVAATAVIVFSLGFFLAKTANQTVSLASNDWNSEAPYLLPDGSKVTFKGESGLTYKKRFKERDIDFEGVAVFDVTKDAKHPFTIHCNDMAVEVLGTSFLVDAAENSDRYIVDLYSGKVRMTAPDGNGDVDTVELLPGERAVLDLAEGKMNRLSYAEVKAEELTCEHVLDFNDVSLSTIVETLEYIYEIKIVLPSQYADGKLTARFTDEDSVDDVMETIATVFGFEFDKSGSIYVIR